MIDSHCHLDHEPLFSNLDDVIQRSKDIGISKILTICTTLNSFVKIKEIINKTKINKVFVKGKLPNSSTS